MSLLSLALIVVMAANNPVAEELRHSARIWEARDRTDLARQSLEKLASLRGAQVSDLLLLGEIDLRQGNVAGAQQVLVRMHQEFPSSAEARTLAIEVRVATLDRLGLASVHRLVQVGRGDEVRPALHRLFPDGAPDGILGLEYYQLLAAATDGRVDAQNGLAHLMRSHPKDPRYVLGLARLLARWPTTARAAIALIEPLRSSPDVRAADYHEILDLSQATLAQAPADTAEESLPVWNERSAKIAPQLTVPLDRGTAVVATTEPNYDPETNSVAAAAVAVAAVGASDAAVTQSEVESPSVLIWQLYRDAQRLAAAGDEVAAQARMHEMAERYPESSDRRFADALWAESHGQAGRARQLVDGIPPDDRGEGVRRLLTRLSSPDGLGSPSAVRTMVGSDQIYWSLQSLNKPGVAGISALKSVVLPFEWRHALVNNTQLGFRVEAVSLDAGNVPLTAAEAGGLGTVAVGGLGAGAGASTATQGLALGLAWHHNDWVVDVGTTPLGFAVSRWTGGVRYAPTLGGLDVSVEAFRRAVTSSLLSYAGRTDPATGRIWGAIMESGVSGRIGHYEENSSLSIAINASRMQGTEVAPNSHYSLRLSADRVVATLSHSVLSLGVALGYQAYQRNLLGYTFGDGGYFSPQSYSAIALPIEWTRRFEPSALRLRIAPTLTHRHDSDAPWYPTDAMASAAVSAAGGDPRVLGGTVNGLSVSLSLIYERRVKRGLLGVSFEHDRSDYYRPVSLMLYFRPGGASDGISTAF